MLRIVCINLAEQPQHQPWDTQKNTLVSAIEKINPHILVIKNAQAKSDLNDGKDQGLQLYEESKIFSFYHYSVRATQGDEKIGCAILAKFPIIEKHRIKVNTGDGRPVTFLKSSFERPLGKFDLYIADLSAIKTSTCTLGEASTFLSTGNTLSVISGTATAANFNPFVNVGFIAATISGEDEPGEEHFWLSHEIAEGFNKLELENFDNVKAYVLELNIKMHELNIY
ncbi:MAG TPA: hypothetical protein VD927_02985 [Chryseosolibacter sp.]|nr:hypothetical protein [Chryseosolibacter sp.]